MPKRYWSSRGSLPHRLILRCRVVSHAKTPDDSFNVYADIVVVQQGRAISVATMTGFIEPLATASEARLVRTIASRLGARVGAA